MPKSEPLTSVDAAWLHMDKPDSLATITSVVLFDQSLDFERVWDTFAYRLLPFFRRFRQRIREPRLGLGLPRWELDPEFDLARHIEPLSLPAPRDEAALQAAASHLLSQPLDRRWPLWHVAVVERYRGGGALITRLHHCLGDGLALVHVLLSMADDAPDAPWPAAPAPAERDRRPWLARLTARAAGTAEHALNTAEHWLKDGWDALNHPLRPADQLALGGAYALALSKLTLASPDRKTVFRGKLGRAKRLAWSRPIALDAVKAAGHALDGTVNDVLLAAVAGGLRRYLEQRDQPVAGLNLRAMVPVNLRRPGERLDGLGNRFGLILLALPVGVRDPARRVRVLKGRMDAIKSSPEALVAFRILGAMGLTPTQVEDLILRFFAAKATAVMTNVPGPRETLYFAGRPIRRMLVWAPHPGQLGLGVSILSYAGQVTVGIDADAGLVPDPAQLVAAFEDEFAALIKAVPGPRRPPRTRAAGRCQAKTQAGAPCRNSAAAGSRFCRRHSPA
ncbi:MAG: wax ester/triacylglycerol synthase family O-acyltransferase [Anaerolineales bacterium]|nr:wax ester/triacylglycerol synthase family O-acyltransferase [Anaerolineales bacterium]